MRICTNGASSPRSSTTGRCTRPCGRTSTRGVGRVGGGVIRPLASYNSSLSSPLALAVFWPLGAVWCDTSARAMATVIRSCRVALFAAQWLPLRCQNQPWSTSKGTTMSHLHKTRATCLGLGWWLWWLWCGCVWCVCVQRGGDTCLSRRAATCMPPPETGISTFCSTIRSEMRFVEEGVAVELCPEEIPRRPELGPPPPGTGMSTCCSTVRCNEEKEMIVGTSTSCSASCGTRTAVRIGTSKGRILGTSITCSGSGESARKNCSMSGN